MDKSKPYSISAKDLGVVERELDELSTELVQPEDVPIMVSLSCNIGEYICKQLRRLQDVRHIRDVDLAAYYSRCIFEAVLMLEYMLRHAANEDSRRVLLEMMQDHLDVVEGVISLVGEYGKPEDRLETYRETLKRNIEKDGARLSRTPRVSELARKVGADVEYAGLYKLYSKYTHPSAYLLFSSSANREAESCLSVFRHRSYVYAKQAIRTYEEVKDLFPELYEEDS